MESSEKDNGTVCQGPSAQPKRTIKFKPNVLRFRKFYWILGTFGVALAALSLYYMVYVSSQRAYYSERSFRLLGSMGDKLVLDVDLVRNVLAAAASQGRLKAANEYIQWSLHGTLEEQDFVVTSLQNSDKRRFRSHAGLLTLFSPEIPNTPIVRADYREPNPNAPSVRADYTEPKVANPDNFCAKAVTEIVACATVDLSSLVRPAFQELGQDFFQDVLIADSSGQVLFQQWGAGTRVHNLSALFPQPKGGKTDTVSPNRDNSVGPVVAEFSRVSQYSNVVEIDLAGSRYQLFIEPLPVSLHVPGKGSRRLVLCGLRSLKHGESQAMALPHTYLIWAILVVLAAFTLTWPFLKFVYMSSKEKLQTRHVLYFLLSVTVATASVTLIALNFAYKLTENKSSEYEIQQLAHKLNSNIVEELRSALKTVDVLAAKDSRLLPLALDSPVCGETEKTSRWNEAQFLQKHAKLLPKIQRPYFRYFFLADEEGCQRLKVTVNPRTTPQVRINLESYFHPVKDTELSHLPKTDQGTETYDFRMQPLFSSNTGEFLLLLAAPFDAQKDKQLAALRLRVKALAIRFESLFNPVLPLGYGYAVVDPSGRVLFDSISARNLTEDFTKESRADPGLRALLAQGTTGVVDAMYLGTQKKLLVTPVAGLSDPRLTLIVYKDSTYFTTLNTAIMVSVIVLLALYALPFWIFVLVHMARNSDYPLKSIWPHDRYIHSYFRIFVANSFLSGAFVLRYVSYSADQTFANVYVVGLVASLYCLLERRSALAQRLGRALTAVALLYLSWGTWTMVYTIVFTVLAVVPGSVLQQHHFIRRILPLKRAYTLFLISLLLVYVIVPSCAFFKVSYEYVQRLFVQEQQLDLADKLQGRQDNIENYYRHLDPDKSGRLSSFAEARKRLSWDRYDGQFLNCPHAGSVQLPNQRIRRNVVGDVLLWMTTQFPTNVLAAQLRQLAASKVAPPGMAWRFGGRVDTCEHRTAVGSLWLTNIANTPAEPLPIVSPYPALGPLTLPVRCALGLAIIGLALWIHFVPSKLFLLDEAELSPLNKWRPTKETRFLPQNLLILGHPKSGKRLTVKRLPEVQIVDFVGMATTGKWEVPAANGIIALNHVEFGIDDPEFNLRKLQLIEDLVYFQHRRTILLSTVDPLFYLTQGAPDVIVTEKQDSSDAVHLLDRWAAVLTSFRKMTIDDITEDVFKEVVDGLKRRRPDRLFQDFIKHVVRECDHTAQLRKIGGTVLRAHRDKEGLSPEALVQELLDRADAYYRVLWSTCTENERIVLYQLSEDGWANFKNVTAIHQLLRRKLVTRSDGLRVMNESFRQFVRRSQYREEIEAWEQEGRQSVWQSLKLSLGVSAVLVAAWLFYSQQQFFNSLVVYISAFGAAAAVLVKWFADLRGTGKGSGTP